MSLVDVLVGKEDAQRRGVERRVARVARRLKLWTTRGAMVADNPQGRIPNVPLIKGVKFHGQIDKHCDRVASSRPNRWERRQSGH